MRAQPCDLLISTLFKTRKIPVKIRRRLQHQENSEPELEAREEKDGDDQ